MKIALVNPSVPRSLKKENLGLAYLSATLQADGHQTKIIDEIAGVPADEVTPDKSFVDDLDIDSLSMVEIAVAAQDKFGVEIPDEQLKDLKTVQDVINFVSKNS